MFTLTHAAKRAVLVAAVTGVAALLATPVTASADAIDSGVLARVPAEFAPWIRAAPATCVAAQITPAFVAAQLEAEAGFDSGAIGPLGQAGAAQLFPVVGAELRDDDGNGLASPFDIGDAVHALVRIDCRLVDELTAAGKPTDPEAIAAAYSAGVSDHMDLPAVREYARSVLDRI